MGRDPSGRAYMYKPDPSIGDRALVTGSDADVRRELAGYRKRLRPNANGSAPTATITNMGE